MPGHDALRAAARAGDLARARALLDDGADADATCAAGWSPLILATVGGHEPLVELLLARGARARPAPRGAAGAAPTHTALRAAALCGRAAIARRLLAAGAAADAASEHARTPLMGACRPRAEAATDEVLAILELLLERLDEGAINAYNDDGESALALAIARDDRATATRLLNAGATATREDERNCLSTDMRALVKGARSRKRARHGDGAGDV